MHPDTLPPCALAMSCLCAAHALGAPSNAPCNADEDSALAEWGETPPDDDDYDPTPYELSSDPDPADTIRDSQVDAMRYKR